MYIQKNNLKNWIHESRVTDDIEQHMAYGDESEEKDSEKEESKEEISRDSISQCLSTKWNISLHE